MEDVSTDGWPMTAFVMNSKIYLKQGFIFREMNSLKTKSRNRRGSALPSPSFPSTPEGIQLLLMSISMSIATLLSTRSSLRYSSVQRTKVQMRKWLQDRCLSKQVRLRDCGFKLERKDSLRLRIFGGMLLISCTYYFVFQNWRQMIARGSASKMFTLQFWSKYSRIFWQG